MEERKRRIERDYDKEWKVEAAEEYDHKLKRRRRKLNTVKETKKTALSKPPEWNSYIMKPERKRKCKTRQNERKNKIRKMYSRYKGQKYTEKIRGFH